MPDYKATLETERLILRLPVPDDFEAFHSWGSNPENTRYMTWGPNNEEQTKEFLAGVKPGRDFAVVLKETNAVIGSCGIYPNDTGYMGELGWILHKDYWKKGYGTELGKALVKYGFEDLKLGRIQAPCAAVNYGSYRVMERIGMKREALHRKAFWARVDKEWVDEAWYAILAEDYFSANLSARFGNEGSMPDTITVALDKNSVGIPFEWVAGSNLSGSFVQLTLVDDRIVIHRPTDTERKYIKSHKINETTYIRSFGLFDINIPIRLLIALKVRIGDKVDLKLEDDHISIRRHMEKPEPSKPEQLLAFCCICGNIHYTGEGLTKVLSKYICHDCAEAVKKI